jgi:hypothetical protein
MCLIEPSCWSSYAILFQPHPVDSLYVCYILWLNLVALYSSIMRFQIIFWYISKLFLKWKKHISFANFCGVCSFSAINFTIMKIFILQFSSQNVSTFYLVFTRMTSINMESQEIHIQLMWQIYYCEICLIISYKYYSSQTAGNKTDKTNFC